jgi:chondroitin synthase
MKRPPDSNDYRSIADGVVLPVQPWLTVSVIIPFYQDLSLLDLTLASLAGQDYPGSLLEVIVVEDGSPESTRGLVERWERRLAVRTLRIPRNGPRRATARNVGILDARGDVILSVDSDMALPPGCVAAHLRWFHTSTEVATLSLRRFIEPTGITAQDVLRDFGRLRRLPETSSASNLGASLRDKRETEMSAFYNHPHPYNCFHGCNVAYRRADALDVGLWNDAFDGNYGYEDVEFGYRLWRAGRYLVFEPDALAYHLESRSMSREQRLAEAAVNRAKLYQLIPELAAYRSAVGASP